jgi:hypothetical protein
MLRNPQYAGYTNIIVARLQEINRMRGAAQGAQPQQPPVAQQAMQGMSRGGIVSFRDGGKVRKFSGVNGGSHIISKGREVSEAEKNADNAGYASVWGDMGTGLKKAGLAAQDILFAAPVAAAERVGNLAIGLPNAMGANIPYLPETSPTHFMDRYNANDASPRAQLDKWSGANPAYPIDKSKYENGAPGDVPTVINGTKTPFTDEEIERLAERGIFVPGHPPKSKTQLPQYTRQYVPPSNIGGLDALSRRGGGEYPTASLQDYYNQINGLIGNDEEDAKSRAELAKQKERSPWMNVMMGGLTMAEQGAANPNAGILGNFATGAKTGLEGYGKDQSAFAARQDALNKQARAERLGIAGLAVNEIGQDKRLQAQLAMQRLQLKIGAKPFQALEAKMQRYAAERAKADRDKGVYQPDSEYDLEAFQKFSPQIQGVYQRDEAAQLAAYQKALHDWVVQGRQGYFPSSFEEWKQTQLMGGVPDNAVVRE